MFTQVITDAVLTFYEFSSTLHTTHHLPLTLIPSHGVTYGCLLTPVLCVLGRWGGRFLREPWQGWLMRGLMLAACGAAGVRCAVLGINTVSPAMRVSLAVLVGSYGVIGSRSYPRTHLTLSLGWNFLYLVLRVGSFLTADVTAFHY